MLALKKILVFVRSLAGVDAVFNQNVRNTQKRIAVPKNRVPVVLVLYGAQTLVKAAALFDYIAVDQQRAAVKPYLLQRVEPEHFFG